MFGRVTSIRKFLLVYLMLSIFSAVLISSVLDNYSGWLSVNTYLDKQLQVAVCIFNGFTRHIPFVKLKTMSKDLKFMSMIDGEENVLKKEIESDQSLKGYFFEIVNQTGQVLFKTSNAPSISIVNSTGMHTYTDDEKSWRVATYLNNTSGILYAVGELQSKRFFLIKHIAFDAVYVAIILFPLFFAIIFFILAVAFRGINNLCREIKNRSAECFDPINISELPAEIVPLVDSINLLLKRLNDEFDREQRFSADAAHELRTPLAVLKTQAQIALRCDNIQDMYAAIKSIVGITDRCAYIVQQLLILNRVALKSIPKEELSLINMNNLIVDVINMLMASAIEKNIEIEVVKSHDDCIYSIDGSYVAIHSMIRNLLDNSIKYTQNGGFVKIFLDYVGTDLEIKVLDNGPGILDAYRTRVFGRFFRILGTKVQGSGLGLAIVKQVVQLHNGTVMLDKPSDSGGLLVTIKLPINYVRNTAIQS